MHKQRSGASELLDQITIPVDAVEALVHVRDYTKGHPSIAANNHPVRHGPVVGIHNGIIVNDDELFEQHGWRRAEPEMTVDSEAIFALAEATENRAEALEQLYGAMATAWVDERRPGLLFLARGVGRPLWLGRGQREIFFASTLLALETVERYAGVKSPEARGARGHDGRALRRPRRLDGAVPPGHLVRRGRRAARNPHAGRGRALPQAARRRSSRLRS